MAEFWTLVAVLSCAVTFLRIITWQPEGERFRIGMGLCAYALAACTGCFVLTAVLHLLSGASVDPVSPWLALVLAWLAVLVVLARGNVARIVQLNWSSHWDGTDRRRAQR